MESFIEILKVIFLGIVEGITEWLPISSTGHLILVEEFVKLNVSQEFWDMFMVVIQLGAILAVVVLYWKDLWPFRNKKPKHENVTKVEKAAGVLCRFVKIDKMIMWFKILVSCLPAIIIGLPFNDFIEEKFNNWFVVSVMLIVYGVMFLIVEDYNEKRQAKYNSISEITWKTALFIGIFQVRSYYYRWYPGRSLQDSGSGIYLFPCHSCNVWRQSSENSKIRHELYFLGSCDPAGRYGGFLSGIYSGY